MTGLLLHQFKGTIPALKALGKETLLSSKEPPASAQKPFKSLVMSYLNPDDGPSPYPHSLSVFLLALYHLVPSLLLVSPLRTVTQKLRTLPGIL